MAIEYIGEIALRAPQHIEDKLAAMAEQATQGARAIKGAYVVQIIDGRQGQTIADYCPWMGTPNAAGNAALHVAQHNTHPALIAVVRAARAAKIALSKVPRSNREAAARYDELHDALAALDAMEV